MTSKWDKYSRLGLEVASTATSLGFSAAKAGTKLGFSITRGIASTAAGVTGSAVDRAFFGGSMGAGPMLYGAISTAISSIESLALAPILIGESLTSTSLVAAHSTLSLLSTVFPGSDEASFSLASFVELVRREWSEPAESEGLPEERFGITQIIKALAGWATLQGVTGLYHERQWFEVLKEIQVNDEQPEGSLDAFQIAGQSTNSHDPNVHITTDVIYPHGGGQIVTADIGEVATQIPTPPVVMPNISSRLPFDVHPCMSNTELKQTLRRLSKLVLAGYGGPSLLFFGVSPWPTSTSNKSLHKEEAKLTDAVGASEAETLSSRFIPSCGVDDSTPEPGKPSYSWWDVLMGRHDHDIFLGFANSHPPQTTENPDSSRSDPLQQQPRPHTAYVGNESLMPRFWVLTDHARREVVLVVRGTMSLNELAVDLTCEPVPFELHTTSPSRSRSKPRTDGAHAAQETNSKEEDGSRSELEEDLGCIPGSFPIDISTPAPTKRSSHQACINPPMNTKASSHPDDLNSSVHLVHGGMLKMARAMGAPGKPVHVAVRDALRRNRGYSLVLCGHSLGAGVAALLSLMWADPHTRLTHRHSRLPQHRLVSAYCFAPPCLTSPYLASIAGKHGLVTSFVYGHDIVSRLSLGSMRDLSRCCAWLCQAEVAHGEGHSAVTKRALRWKAGYGGEEDEKWFLAMRKTLEANMYMTQLFPPGCVFWALRDGDLHPSHRLRETNGTMRSSRGEDKVRLFHVLDVERAFSQIVFARDMLSAHMPHQYDRAVHELL